MHCIFYFSISIIHLTIFVKRERGIARRNSRKGVKKATKRKISQNKRNFHNFPQRERVRKQRVFAVKVVKNQKGENRSRIKIKKIAA